MAMIENELPGVIVAALVTFLMTYGALALFSGIGLMF